MNPLADAMGATLFESVNTLEHLGVQMCWNIPKELLQNVTYGTVLECGLLYVANITHVLNVWLQSLHRRQLGLTCHKM